MTLQELQSGCTVPLDFEERAWRQHLNTALHTKVDAIAAAAAPAAHFGAA